MDCLTLRDGPLHHILLLTVLEIFHLKRLYLLGCAQNPIRGSLGRHHVVVVISTVMLEGCNTTLLDVRL